MGRKLVVIYFMLFVISTVLYIFCEKEYNEPLLLMTLFGVVFSVVLFSIRKEPNRAIKGQYFRPVIFFLLGYIIVHFQMYADIILGNIPVTDSFMFINESIICKAALLSLIGLLSFFIGYLISKSYVSKKCDYKHKICSLKPLVILFYLLTAIFIYSAGDKYIDGGYGTVNISSTMASYATVLIQLVTSTIFIINSLNYRVLHENISIRLYVKSFGIFFYISLAIYCFAILMSGDRGPVISIAMGYLFSYIIASKRKMKLPVLTTITLIGAIVVTTLGIARSLSQDKLQLHEKIKLALSEDKTRMYDSFSDGTIELAGSVRTLHSAMITVPNTHPYLYGAFHLRYILMTIPFSSVVTKELFRPEVRYVGSAEFLTWVDQGDFPSYGVGTSCIADLYLDFGFMGVVIGMFLFGLLIRWVEVRIMGQSNISIFNYALGFYIMTIALYFSRSSILYNLYGFVWLYIVLMSYLLVMKKNTTLK